VIGRFRANLAAEHHLLTTYADGILKTVNIPELEQRNVQTDMARVKASVLKSTVIETAEMFAVVHLF